MEINKLQREITILAVIAAFAGGIFIGNKVMNAGSQKSAAAGLAVFEQAAKEMESVNAEVIPAQGFSTKISFGDAIPKLVAAGVIDTAKFEELYAERGGMTEEQKKLFTEPSSQPMVINENNAGFVLNLLWPLGIANKNLTLTESEAGKPENVFNLASTGGWTLGKEQNGGSYYNKFEIIKLTPEQDALVKRVAENIYRPCCGNSTAFPDCNHGAAMLGMLQLGASQGLSEEELYNEGLKFNTMWFPDTYVKMGMMFKYLQNKQWEDADPKLVLGKEYSSGRGFGQNVALPLSKIPGLMPGGGHGGGGGSCSA